MSHSPASIRAKSSRAVRTEPRVAQSAAARRALGAALLAGALTTACGGGKTGTSGSSSGVGGGGIQGMAVAEVWNGFGALLPHQTFRVDQATGNVTSQLMAIRSVDDVVNNVRVDNPVLPPAQWDEDARLPNGQAGNHFVMVRLTGAIDPDSIFDLSPSGVANNFLSGSLQVVGYDPSSGLSTPLEGRAFLGGRTPAATVQPSGLHDLQQWVGIGPGGVEPIDENGAPVPAAVGFPGTQAPFTGAAKLVEDGVFVFVADQDGDLSTHDTFPDDLQIRVEMTTGVRSVQGEFLGVRAVASSTVGPDTLAPRVATRLVGADVLPNITPGNGLEGVDPSTTVRVEFSEPIEPSSLGVYDLPENFFEFGSALQMTFGPPEFLTTMQYKVRVLSPYDLTTFEFVPAYPFPGTGPVDQSCDEYSRVDMRVAPDTLRDTAGNTNSAASSTFFTAGAGRVVTNAPVMPDAIYVGRTNTVGISVIDLSGFGAGTGSPAFEAGNPWKTGNSRLRLNPNVANGSAMVPPLAAGNCTFNGGSSGALTLTRNSVLDTRLVTSPLIENVTDMAVGYSLDVVFNNAPPPFGCQAGNPNACAATGLKNPAAVIQPPTIRPPVPGETSVVPAGSPNLISWAPHPNPPPLSFPPLCISPFIEAQEPTGVDTMVANTLSPNGNPLGTPSSGIPPNGLWTTDQYVYFNGPSRPQADPSACQPFGTRQQVGHFLYVADRLRNEVVVLNSNRMRVIDRIKVADPTNMAMSPNLDLLAVTNRIANQVTFIDVLPTSSTFNQVIKTVDVGKQPVAIAWQPDNEDILVVNQGDDTLSLIRAFDLEVRKTVSGSLDRPVDIAVGPRQVNGLGLSRNTYFAFVANSNGSIAIFESGPDGVGGWGPDSLLGTATQTFTQPRKVSLDRTFLTGAVWVAHVNPINTQSQLPVGTNEGALSQLRVSSAVTGQIPVTGQVNLTSRQLDLDVTISIDQDVLSGAPVDIAFDCMMNVAGAQPNPVTAFSAPGNPVPVNGKGWYRVLPGPTFIPASTPTFLFVAVPNAGVVDVLRVQGGFNKVDVDVTTPGTQSIPATGSLVLCDYWRQ